MPFAGDKNGSYAASALNSGAIRAAGSLINIQFLTSGTTYTPTTGTKSALLLLLGGGGGGGGVAGGAVNGAAAKGGGAGALGIKYVTGITGTYTYSIGALGAGGTAGNNAGTDGGSTTFVKGGTTYTAQGGTGGTGMAAVAGAFINTGIGGGAANNCDINGFGANGTGGVGLSVALVRGGDGGSTAFGSGGLGVSTSAIGGIAGGYGGGGGGAASTDGSNYAGGDGKQGFIMVYEYA